MNFYGEKINDFIKRCMIKNYYQGIDIEKKDNYKNIFKEIVKNNVDLLNNDNNINIVVTTNINVNPLDLMGSLCNVTIKKYDEYSFDVNEMLFLVIYNFISEINDSKNIFVNMIPINIDIVFSIVFKILIYHELGHIYKGHFLYKQKYKIGKDKAENKLDILTLEYDADSYAFTAISEIIMKDYKNVLMNNFNMDQFKNKVENFRIIFIYLIFSIRLLFFVFSDYNDFENIDNNAHPPMLLREIWAKETLEHFYKDKKAIDNQFDYFITEFNKYYNKKDINDINLVISNNKEKMYQLNNKIINNWKNKKEKIRELYYFSHHNDI